MPDTNENTKAGRSVGGWTPGPWRTEEGYVFARNEAGKPRFSTEVRAGKLWEGGDARDTPKAELRANARLIAAAPELYEVLAECLGSGTLLPHFSDLAERALAKARGERP